MRQQFHVRFFNPGNPVALEPEGFSKKSLHLHHGTSWERVKP
jgi:hypothetical protein